MRRSAFRSLALLSIVGAVACGTLLDGEDEADPSAGRAPDAASEGGVEPGDEADSSAAADAHDAHDAGPDAPRLRRVFVTKGTFTGNVGGIDGGDDLCAAEAAANGLPGSFLAYLHRGGGDPGHPAHRLEDAGWARVDGVVAFTGHPHKALPVAAVELDGDGGLVPPDARVWTGLYIGPSGMCDSWTSTSQQSLERAGVGDPHAVNMGRWHNTGAIDDCNEKRHLYCFER